MTVPRIIHEPIVIPPGHTIRIVCQNFPECMCGEDCTRADPESPTVRRILIGLLIAVGVIGAGLVLVGLR
ncbi:hypothetical protein LB519_14885 [Mesorhizobium sp. AD1-1]|uniref:hypothetical protein n=1 Tax=Mesorhizobium sp. AD1-1 TaxID=2876621 RepID=UPI001CCB41C1|nr:hypothetical protein [Mesorhizobium sp. AD1-1]MBZ9719132.1 hypothetical protein [Mesorhizobium sp. AD1-1]